MQASIIAGRNNVGYIATASDRQRGAELYRVNVLNGKSRKLGIDAVSGLRYRLAARIVELAS